MGGNRMIFWFIIGFVIWTLCILLLLVILKGGSIDKVNWDKAKEKDRTIKTTYVNGKIIKEEEIQNE
jgi:hypothetical protein